jgi:hypothetical protein
MCPVTPKPENRELIKSWAPERNLEDHIVSAMVEARRPLGRWPASELPSRRCAILRCAG